MALTPRQRQAAIDELRRRPERESALAIERGRRAARREALVATMHAKQRQAHELIYSNTYTAICAGRRSGKTYLDAIEVAYALDSCGRDEWVVFMADTGQTAKELIWSELVALKERHGFDWSMREHPIPTITTSTGGKFKVIGCNDKSELGKLRGKKYRLVIIDEAKEVSAHLRELVQEIFRPAFMGVGGRIVVSGTPGKVCDTSDYWYAVCHGATGWARITDWTIADNPWFTDPAAELRKVRLENDWDELNPIYRREYLGEWRSDEDERVYPYAEERNAVHGLPPHYDADTWTHVIGVDIGFQPDPAAWVVLACHPNERDVYAIHAEKRGELFSDQVAEYTGRLARMYRPSAIVADSGGQGKPYLEDMNRRHSALMGVHVKAADKRQKRDRIEVVGDELRVGRLRLCLPHTRELADEMLNLHWKDSRREVEHSSMPNHVCDAMLYAHTEMREYWNLPKAPEQTDAERALETVRARQRRAAGEMRAQSSLVRR